ncbi:fructosamine kinase family protein [Bacillus shivajii]|uniref:fructosamine kinase family protein n=1 Tax=Bacillus shivajii TaxID=1983719 RepID=UPI001CFA8C8A|nr:fructosamine kinase family protein [Bacillus shivajii]UCZ54897.1 fructosamine kinase family protein [Bacillus shivajii]
MIDHIKNALREINDHSNIKKIKNVSGGEINEAFFVETTRKPYFIKINRGVPRDFFEAEFAGLQEMKKVEAIHTPEVYGVYACEETTVSGLMLEWIERGQSPHFNERLGEATAQLHQFTCEKYGFKDHTYIGELHQPNGLWENWRDYFIECRLKQQMNLAIKRGYMNNERHRKMEQFIDLAEEALPSNPQASLLHGDLWSGNVLCDTNGNPYFIDPSVYYGHHEVDLAFTELFGGFSHRFYEAYKTVKPIDTDYENRKPIYQMFYLLVHLNTFGEMYGSHVDDVLSISD